MTKKTIETKVVAATGGSGAGAVVATFVLWLLGSYVWHAPSDSANAEKAIAAVPSPVAALVVLGISALGAFVAGWLAPHTPRGNP